MAVIFAVVGGGAIVGIANSDPYSDHSDYSNYGNYSNYSDAAERRNRRIAAKEQEVKQGIQEVNQFKIYQVNNYLENQQLISEPGETVSVDAVRNDGYNKIQRDESKIIKKETKEMQEELKDIITTITAIDNILEDKE